TPDPAAPLPVPRSGRRALDGGLFDSSRVDARSARRAGRPDRGRPARRLRRTRPVHRTSVCARRFAGRRATRRWTPESVENSAFLSAARPAARRTPDRVFTSRLVETTPTGGQRAGGSQGP